MTAYPPRLCHMNLHVDHSAVQCHIKRRGKGAAEGAAVPGSAVLGARNWWEWKTFMCFCTDDAYNAYNVYGETCNIWAKSTAEQNNSINTSKLTYVKTIVKLVCHTLCDV